MTLHIFIIIVILLNEMFLSRPERSEQRITILHLAILAVGTVEHKNGRTRDCDIT